MRTSRVVFVVKIFVDGLEICLKVVVTVVSGVVVVVVFVVVGFEIGRKLLSLSAFAQILSRFSIKPSDFCIVDGLVVKDRVVVL